MGIIADAKVEVKFAASRSVDLAGGYRVYANDGAGGAVDYDTPLNGRLIAPWPRGGRYRGGFGHGPFGKGGFGYGDGGVGFGNGPFGAGPFGRGTHTITFLTNELPDGDYDLAVVGYDAAGNADGAGLIIQVSVSGEPEPPGVPTAAKADPEVDTITLTWPLSSDDAAA